MSVNANSKMRGAVMEESSIVMRICLTEGEYEGLAQRAKEARMSVANFAHDMLADANGACGAGLPAKRGRAGEKNGGRVSLAEEARNARAASKQLNKQPL